MTQNLGLEVPITEAEPDGTPRVTGSAKVVTVWNTRTHEELRFNGWNVPDALKKKHKDPAYPEWVGKPLFSLKKTGERVLGTYKCLLNPSQLWRAEYERQGFPACPASHLASEEQVRLHMRGKHKSEWARLEDDRKERERQEDRDLARKQIEAMAAIADRNGHSEAALAPRNRGGRPRKNRAAETQSSPE